jgi:hypothetical protein
VSARIVRVEDHSREFLRAVDQAGLAGIYAAAVIMTQDVQQRMINSARGGRIYPSRKGPGQTHKASAPGESPAVDLGELVGSITQSRVRSGPVQSVVQMGSTIQRGLLLEYGTSRILPRPAFRPALARVDGMVAGLVMQAYARTGGTGAA